MNIPAPAQESEDWDEGSESLGSLTFCLLLVEKHAWELPSMKWTSFSNMYCYGGLSSF